MTDSIPLDDVRSIEPWSVYPRYRSLFSAAAWRPRTTGTKVTWSDRDLTLRSRGDYSLQMAEALIAARIHGEIEGAL